MGINVFAQKPHSTLSNNHQMTLSIHVHHTTLLEMLRPLVGKFT
jgi:hypothetical protein